MKTPKQMEKQVRKFRHRLCAQGRLIGTGMHVESIEQAGFHKRRMAVISVGKTDFYNPAVAIRRTLLNLFDPELAPRPISHVEPGDVDYSSPTEAGFRKHSHVPAKMFIARMRSIVGREPYLRCWKSSHKYGMFFLFSNRVLLQTWSCKEGFRVQQVPEDGIDVGITSRKHWR